MRGVFGNLGKTRNSFFKISNLISTEYLQNVLVFLKTELDLDFIILRVNSVKSMECESIVAKQNPVDSIRSVPSMIKYEFNPTFTSLPLVRPDMEFVRP